MVDSTMSSYRDPAGGTDSDVGTQFRTDYYQKKALIEARKEQYFSQLADTVSMPKHMGKTIKRYHYMPLLDDANINDQGIDAAGLVGDGVSVGTVIATTKIVMPDVVEANANYGGGDTYYVTGENAVTATAEAAALAAANALAVELGFANAAAIVTAGGTVTVMDTVSAGGNLYGSSKDVGTIQGKLPTLTEHGGRVNRVGFKRLELQGSLEKFGFFDEYTQESMDFDTDSELMMHINREMINGANEITEDALQIDLLNSAGVVRYGGVATEKAEITGVAADTVSVIDYEDLMRLSIDLDNNRCPKNTKMITGTRMVDTKTVYAARYLYIGSELIPMIRRMTDLHGNPAFIPVQQYGAAGQVANGEMGSVDQFRIIVVPEMMHWSGAGAAEGVNAGYRATGGNYDVFPMLVVGSESFTTIGFQTSGKSVKFKITHKKPGRETADRNDPYGETGFMSIKWYYGFMVLRPERIALCLSVAEI